jgi:hypothetical protein
MRLLHQDFHKLMKSGRINKVVKMAMTKPKKERPDGHEKTKRRNRV